MAAFSSQENNLATLATTHQVKPLSKIVFDKYDVDESGYIDVYEFKYLCYDLGHYLSDEEIALGLTQIDVNADGEISYAEFAKWWQKSDRFEKLQLTEEGKQALMAASQYFQYFDADKSGSIDSNEFKPLYADLIKNGFQLGSLEEAQKELDMDGDGRITFVEYVDWLKRIGSLPSLS